MYDVTAICVTYNSAGVIEATLQSLSRIVLIKRIIVVDNASQDNTRELVATRFPHVTIIANATNEGFGRANNKALSQVTTPYALLINPDAQIDQPALEQLCRAAERYNDAAILAPLLCDERQAIYPSHKRHVFEREARRDRYHVPEGDLCANYLSGAIWLLPMPRFTRTGFFDSQIFLYYEDDDLCLRVKKAGFSCILVASAQATHVMGSSSGPPSPAGERFKQYHMIASRLYIEQKYRGPYCAQTLRIRLMLGYAIKACLYGLTGNKMKWARYAGRLSACYRYTNSSHNR
ncbi:MAG: glycosyltransferase family 2 protein [Rickettsiales bacterium]|nr:glycosyltransferase family 2 protein [Rickettsiales bacterium]